MSSSNSRHADLTLFATSFRLAITKLYEVMFVTVIMNQKIGDRRSGRQYFKKGMAQSSTHCWQPVKALGRIDNGIKLLSRDRKILELGFKGANPHIFFARRFAAFALKILK